MRRFKACAAAYARDVVAATQRYGIAYAFYEDRAIIATSEYEATKRLVTYDGRRNFIGAYDRDAMTDWVTEDINEFVDNMD